MQAVAPSNAFEGGGGMEPHPGAGAACREIIVIGSQALLASCPEAPEELLRSMEVDCYPLEDPAKADLIDGSIGELSPFHETYGYYAHGIGPETAALPAGWKDIEFVRAMLRTRVVTEAAIRSLAAELNPDQAALLDMKLQVCLRNS